MTVSKKEVKVTSIFPTITTLELIKGGTRQITASVKPANATNKTVKWYSDNTTVATVNESTGLITAKNVGSARIYAVATDGSGVRSTNCYLTVSSGLVTSIVIEPREYSMTVGNSYNLSSSVYPVVALNRTLKWESLDTSVVEVNQSGKITARGVGVTSVRAKSTDGSNIYSNTCVVTVKAATVTKTLRLNNNCITGVVGNTYTLIATVTPASAASNGIAWTSSNTGVAQVDCSGNVTLVGGGEATIRAALSGSNASDTCHVEVTPRNTQNAQAYQIYQYSDSIRFPNKDIINYGISESEAGNAFGNIKFIQKACGRDEAKMTASKAGCWVCTLAMHMLRKSGAIASVGDNTYYAVKNGYVKATTKAANFITSGSVTYATDCDNRICDVDNSNGYETYTINYGPVASSSSEILNKLNGITNFNKGYMLVSELNDAGRSGNYEHAVYLYGKNENATIPSDDTAGLSKYLIIDPSGSTNNRITNLYKMLKERSSIGNASVFKLLIEFN